MIESLVSIIVPNYNSQEFIIPFIESVISQTYPFWELLIVDDNSSDNSTKIIEKFASADQRIKLLRQDASGKGACARRNQGLDEAKGEYVCFFDSDDLLPHDTLEIRVEELKRNPELDFVVTPAITFRKKPFDLKRLVLGIPLFKDDLGMFLKRYRLPFGVWTNIYRRDFLIKQGLRWDTQLASMQDSDFNIQTLLLNPKYKFSDNQTPGYYWRTGGNKNSITKTIKGQKNLSSQIYFYTKLHSIFANTRYKKNLERFGLTILLRCALLQYNAYPDILIKSKWVRIKYNILKRIYRFSPLKKLNRIIDLIFFPLSISDEYFFQFQNRMVCKRYISHHLPKEE